MPPKSNNPAISYVNDRFHARMETANKEGAAAYGAPTVVYLPEHACSLCNYHEDTRCVAKCLDCNKWFCNGKGQLTASHIIAHMAKAKHNRIAFHEDSSIGSDPLECYLCEAKNIFVLGLARDAANEQLIACREPCLHSKELREMGVDPASWNSLIVNRQIISDFCSTPNPDTMSSAMCRPLTSKDLVLAEDAWRVNKDLTVEEAIELASMHNVKGRGKFQKLPTQFRDGQHFRSLFKPLLYDEEGHQMEMDEASRIESVDVTWRPLHGRLLGVFTVAGGENAMSVGRMISFRNAVTGVEYKTTLVMTEAGEKPAEIRYKCDLGRGKEGDPVDGKYTIELIFNPVTFKRMRRALYIFANDGPNGKCCSKQIYDTFLGKRGGMTLLDGVVPTNLDIPGVSPLNEVQRKAVSEVLLRPFSLIQGPPGTGKTTTTATIVYHLNRMFKNQILVCAPSNIAVDELAVRIAKTGLQVVRLVAQSREDTILGNPEVEPLTLHQRVRRRVEGCESHNLLRELTKRLKEQGTLPPSDYEKYIVLYKNLEDSILSPADVICCTSSVAGDKRLEKFLFRHVVIDESAQSHEAETLIPVTLGAEQVILVGDHCQMGPVIVSRAAKTAGLPCTSFERMVKIGHRPYRLEIQYRMHPELSKFSSNMFYDGELQNGVTADERDSSKVFKWPDPTKPFFFFHTTNPEEMGASGVSVLNRKEAHVATEMVSILLKGGVKAHDIGVITPYEAQRNYLVQYLNRISSTSTLRFSDVQVASVDSFQGREKGFIILSCVRSNDSHDIGFLTDWRRMNVALTRARRGVMVIGNAFVLAEDKTWNAYLVHCKKRGLIMHGSVLSMEAANFDIPPPRQGRDTGISEETLALVRGDHAIDTDDENEQHY